MSPGGLAPDNMTAVFNSPAKQLVAQNLFREAFRTTADSKISSEEGEGGLLRGTEYMDAIGDHNAHQVSQFKLIR
jgi:hypothetical protein